MYLSELEYVDPEFDLSTRSKALAALMLEAWVLVRSDPPAPYPVASIYVPFPQSEWLCLRYFGE